MSSFRPQIVNGLRLFLLQLVLPRFTDTIHDLVQSVTKPREFFDEGIELFRSDADFPTLVEEAFLRFVHVIVVCCALPMNATVTSQFDFPNSFKAFDLLKIKTKTSVVLRHPSL